MQRNRKNFNKSFSIILPVLNEEKNVRNLIFLLKKYLKNYKYEIIFIDDNSTDDTRKVIYNYISKNIKYYLRIKNRDLTLSCFLGIEKSKYENVIIMDSDLQHDPRYLPKIVNLYFKKNLDFVVAARNFNEDVGLGIARKFASISISHIFNYFLGYRVSDPMSGFFMFRKSIYYKSRKHLFGKGWKILADFIYNKKKYAIEELQIKFMRRLKNKSKMNLKVLIYIIQLFLFKFKKIKI
jgi:dolichol-phosphate mannosyltransferase